MVAPAEASRKQLCLETREKGFEGHSRVWGSIDGALTGWSVFSVFVPCKALGGQVDVESTASFPSEISAA